MESDTKAFDHDVDVWDTSQDQKRRHLLSNAMTKQQVDNILGEVDGEASGGEASGRTGKSEALTTPEHQVQISQHGYRIPS